MLLCLMFAGEKDKPPGAQMFLPMALATGEEFSTAILKSLKSWPILKIVKSTLSAVHCHGVYEVVVLAFSSPETHGGW